MKIDISAEVYYKLIYLGLIPTKNSPRNHHVGKSNYSQKTIQPWSIWLDYPELSSFDCDIIKRILRTKIEEDPTERYEKVIHICEECLRQIKVERSISNV